MGLYVKNDCFKLDLKNQAGVQYIFTSAFHNFVEKEKVLKQMLMIDVDDMDVRPQT